MRYIELSLNTPGCEIERRCDELTELGATGFVIENEQDFKDFFENNKQYWNYIDEDLEQSFKGVSRIKYYFTDDEDGRAICEAVCRAFPESVLSHAADEDWENNWREYYKPIEVGEKLLIVPQWEKIPEGERIPVILEPGLTFGTGSHASTKMCLIALEKLAGKGKKILDLGCGSGILGIAAMNLGCESCTACDIDPKAPDVAAENAAMNDIAPDRMKIYAGDVSSDRALIGKLGRGYNIVTANIAADTIITLAPQVRQYMAENGVFICSGIIDTRRDEVLQALTKNGFSVIEELHDEEWRAFICK